MKMNVHLTLWHAVAIAWSMTLVGTNELKVISGY